MFACVWVCLYKCACVCECECMSVCECVACMFVHVWVCVHGCMWVSIYVCMQVCEYARLCVCASQYACVNVRAWVCITWVWGVHVHVCVGMCESMCMCARCACVCMCECIYMLCICVWVCMCMRVCASVSADASMWKCQCHMSSSIPLHFFWDSLLNLEYPIQLGWQAGEPLLFGCWGSELRSTWLHSDHVASWAISLDPFYSLKNLKQGLIKLPLLFSNSWSSCPTPPKCLDHWAHPIPGLQSTGDRAWNFAWTNWVLYTLKPSQF